MSGRGDHRTAPKRRRWFYLKADTGTAFVLLCICASSVTFAIFDQFTAAFVLFGLATVTWSGMLIDWLVTRSSDRDAINRQRKAEAVWTDDGPT